MKLKSTLVTVALVVGLFIPFTLAAQQITLMTGPQGGVWVPLGGALKGMWEKAIPGLQLQMQPGAGIANIRGTLYSVVDFSAFQGGEPTVLNSEARLLLVGTRQGINSALLVSRTLGLKNPENLVAEPSAEEGAVPADAARPWLGERYVDKPGGPGTPATPAISWRALRIKPLLNNAEFLDIGL